MDRLMNTLGNLDLVGITAVSVTALVFLVAGVGEVAGWVESPGARATPVATMSASCVRPS